MALISGIVKRRRDYIPVDYSYFNMEKTRISVDEVDGDS